MPKPLWLEPERCVQAAFRVVNAPDQAAAGMARSTSFAQSETP